MSFKIVEQCTPRLNRSELAVPGSSPQLFEKAAKGKADVVFLDLEDAVAPDAKAGARDVIAAALADRAAYGRRELIVRTNGLDTAWGEGDLVAMAKAGADAILLPKVESAAMVQEAVDVLDGAGAPGHLPVWCMMETPRGILHAEEIADHPRVEGFVMGTSDLTKDLQALHTAMRLPMLPSLAICLLAARAFRLAIVDGVYLDLNDADGLEASCRQGRELGFDGKTLIHPAQIAPAHVAFAPTPEERAWAEKVVQAFALPENQGRGAIKLDGGMVELLHLEIARRWLAAA